MHVNAFTHIDASTLCSHVNRENKSKLIDKGKQIVQLAKSESEMNGVRGRSAWK